MIKQLKTLTVNIFAGANVATVLLMLAAGYSDRVSLHLSLQHFFRIWVWYSLYSCW